MRAIRIEQYGGPEVLRRVDIDIPSPARGEVLVRVACAGVNFMDVHTRQGKYQNSRTYAVRAPCTLGMEGAGEVVSTGPDVSSFNPGDRVAWCISWGAYAEYAVVPAHRLARIPGDLIRARRSSHLSGIDCALPRSGRRAVTSGKHMPGACGVRRDRANAGTACQASRRHGLRDRKQRGQGGIARERGADHVMLYENGRFADHVRAITAGVESTWYSTPSGARRCATASARHASGAGSQLRVGLGSLRDLDPYELGEGGSLFLTRPRLADYLADAATVQRRADELFAALEDGPCTSTSAGAIPSTRSRLPTRPSKSGASSASRSC